MALLALAWPFGARRTLGCAVWRGAFVHDGDGMNTLGREAALREPEAVKFDSIPPSSGEKKASHDELAVSKIEDLMGAAPAVASK